MIKKTVTFKNSKNKLAKYVYFRIKIRIMRKKFQEYKSRE